MKYLKKIEGFENYSVSDLGNVRNDKTGRILKEKENRYGYFEVTLMKNKTRYYKKTTQIDCRSMFTKSRK